MALITIPLVITILLVEIPIVCVFSALMLLLIKKLVKDMQKRLLVTLCVSLMIIYILMMLGDRIYINR